MRHQSGIWARVGFWLLSGLALTVALCGVSQAEETQPGPAYSLTILPTRGVNWAGHLDTEWLANLAGGQAGGVVGDTVGHIGFTAASGVFGLPPGGRLTVSLLGVAARGRQGDKFGEVQTLSNNWAPSQVRLYDFYWQQDLRGGNRLRVGMMNVSDYFGNIAVAGQLLNASFGLVPTLSANVADTPTYPYTGTGLVATRRSGPWRAAVGLFEGNPHKPGRPFAGGGMALGEVDRSWEVSGVRNTVGAGWWTYQPAPGQRAASGWYGQAEQLRRWNGRPLGLFLQWGTSSDGQAVPYYLGAGLRLKRPWAARPRDVVSLGVARAWLRGRPQPAETVLEASYIWRLDKWVSLQPDLQWVLHSGGAAPNVLAGILRLHLEFF